MFLLEIFVCLPLFETFFDLVLTQVEHILGVSATSQLQAPSRRVVEIERVVNRASKVVHLEVISGLDIWELSKSLLDRARIVIKAFLVSGVLPVLQGAIADFTAFHFSVAADNDIHDDVLLGVTHIQALVDSRRDIHIPDSSAIHKGEPSEMLRREDERNGA